MRILAFAPAKNTPGYNKKTGKSWNDALGAFQPAARALAAYSAQMYKAESQVWAVYTDSAARVESALSDLSSPSGDGMRYDLVAFFCHGSPNGIQLWKGKTVARMAALLDGALTQNGTLALYACSTAKPLPPPRESFAYQISKALPTRYVLAHEVPGHTCMNPRKVMLNAGNKAWSYPSTWNEPEWSDLWRAKDAKGRWNIRRESFAYAIDELPPGSV